MAWALPSVGAQHAADPLGRQAAGAGQCAARPALARGDRSGSWDQAHQAGRGEPARRLCPMPRAAATATRAWVSEQHHGHARRPRRANEASCTELAHTGSAFSAGSTSPHLECSDRRRVGRRGGEGHGRGKQRCGDHCCCKGAVAFGWRRLGSCPALSSRWSNRRRLSHRLRRFFFFPMCHPMSPTFGRK